MELLMRLNCSDSLWTETCLRFDLRTDGEFLSDTAHQTELLL